MKAATLAQIRGLPRPIALQVEYSLVARDVEAEHIPAAHEGKMGVMPWSPLAGGFLTGKYSRDTKPETGRLSGANPFGDSKFTQRNWDILKGLTELAAELGKPTSEVALAWVMAKPGVTSTLIGARSTDQLKSHLKAADLKLEAEHVKKLDELSAPPLSFSASLTSLAVRRMVFGGQDVKAWGEV
jgi:aryl-alcohol dehydrogenase-like predicted oxidoreductase